MPKDNLDLFKDRHVYTVSEITRDIKLILENTFGQVWVEGEVSGISRISTGTVFFNLKDNASILKCVVFASSAAGLKFQLKDGLKVVCLGRVSVYEKDGKYQLYAESIEPKGLGGLQLALEQLKQKLEKEGLFSPAHKRPIPYLPSKIGVVTSLGGAAIKDVLKVLERRFSQAQVIIKPVRVQGEGAKEEIAQAIEDFNQLNEKLPVPERIEVMIVGRGGGSIEDLWAFNEEIVARAIYHSGIPVVSAVGHERDWTIADLVADLRAPTPSVAAELVLPKKEDLKGRVDELVTRLRGGFAETAFNFQQEVDALAHRLSLNMKHALELHLNKFNATSKKLAMLNPVVLIQQHKIKISDVARQICVRIEHFLRLRQAAFIKAAEKLANLSPLNILSRGYSITFSLPEEKIIKDASRLRPGEAIKTVLSHGQIISQVKEIKPGS